MFEAYITNTALYPLMGIEVGTTVHFPMTTQELQAALAKIGIDGKRYSEVFFTSFDSDVLGLYDHLYECENIDELNELGLALLEVRDKGGLETFEAALVLGNHTRSVKDYPHLLEIDETAQSRLEQMMPQLAKEAGATEELKASDPMKWVGLMNTCKAQAEEILMAELINS